MKVCATTVMMPEHDLPEAAEFLAGLGFDGVEWRCRRISDEQRAQPYSNWGNHRFDLSPDNLGARGGELVAVTRANGLEIACLATNMPASDLDTVRLVAEGCAKHGIGKFRLGAPRGWGSSDNYVQLLDDTRRAFEQALAICAECGVRAILEIHRGTVAMSPTMAYLVVKDFDPAHIGVIFDIANMSLGQGLEPPKVGIDLLGAYVAHVHAGGGRPRPVERRDDGQQGWAWDTVDLADSLLDTASFVRDLLATGYGGFFSVEDFRAMDLTEKLSTNLAYLRAIGAAS
ncbi:MAG: sugar phosphate isomerase/epimerase [Armatimonadetes bacterium]|nr:sugar phosphate isomerase/epimerase [Armatimonadota bacterium]